MKKTFLRLLPCGVRNGLGFVDDRCVNTQILDNIELNVRIKLEILTTQRKVRTPNGSAWGNSPLQQCKEQWNRENVRGFEPFSGNGS